MIFLSHGLGAVIGWTLGTVICRPILRWIELQSEIKRAPGGEKRDPGGGEGHDPEAAGPARRGDPDGEQDHQKEKRD